MLNPINDSEVYGLFSDMNNLKVWFVDITRGGHIVNLDAASLNNYQDVAPMKSFMVKVQQKEFQLEYNQNEKFEVAEW